MSVKCCCYLHCKSHSRTILIMCDHFFPEDDPSLMSSIMGAVASQKRFVSWSVWWILSSRACSSFCSKNRHWCSIYKHESMVGQGAS